MTFIRSLSPRVLLGLAAFVFVLGGCGGGGSTYSYDSGDLAQRFLPTERKIDHHPDSLGALSITQKENGRYQFELERDYESLHRKWSCTYQSMGAGRSRTGRSYATFWSRELSVTALQPEVGLTSLSEKQAEKTLRERRHEYRTTIQIDVFWFEREGNSLLAGPGGRVELHINGNRYQPSKESNGPLREAFIAERTQVALYRRNTFHFPRIVDSTDVLKDAQRMELHIDRAGSSIRVQFAWSWENGSQAEGRLGDRGRVWRAKNRGGN
jgi:hypothetical protein